MTQLVAARGVFILLFATVTYLTLTTNPDDTKSGFDLFDWIAGALFGRSDFGDKLAHFGAYAALGFSSGPAQLKILDRASLVVGALAVYGVLLEIVQHLGGVRDGNVFDAAANALGAGAGFAGFLALMQLLKRRADA